MSETGCRCPFCDSADVETVSAWGGQLMTRQMRCRACNTYFEAVRKEFESAPDSDKAT
jgi:formate dehydrogenase maturation protein FdhE